MMFRYLRDPLFISGWCLYAFNRWLLKPHLPAGETFFRGHFNDLLLVPCVLPLLLLLHRRFSLRLTDAPPTAREVALHLLVWSIYFEFVGPLFFVAATADAWDVLAYWTGGLVAWAVWNRPARKIFVNKRPKTLLTIYPCNPRMK
ncbi:MAG TPA: hypothetical protein VNA19_15515 [Pyrinomonadaceae bacterium]|nr:hypothetical protein [Pyrinomonadaceae bacterium]